jgi:transposase
MATTGSLEPAVQGRPRGTGKLAAHQDRLIAWVEAEPDMSMPELAALLEADCGVIAHPTSLSRLLLASGYTVKKNAAGRRSHTR